jgi:hypothetical protein
LIKAPEPSQETAAAVVCPLAALLTGDPRLDPACKPLSRRPSSSSARVMRRDPGTSSSSSSPRCRFAPY